MDGKLDLPICWLISFVIQQQRSAKWAAAAHL